MALLFIFHNHILIQILFLTLIIIIINIIAVSQNIFGKGWDNGLKRYLLKEVFMPWRIPIMHHEKRISNVFMIVDYTPEKILKIHSE